MKHNYTYKLQNSLISYISPKWTQSIKVVYVP